jgi:hypothetical protein
MGSRDWQRMTTMAESALDAGHHDQCLSSLLRTSQASTETTFVKRALHLMIVR